MPNQPQAVPWFWGQMRGKTNKEKKGEKTRETVGSSYRSVQTDDSILLSLAWYPGEPQELPSNNIARKGSVLIPGANMFVQSYGLLALSVLVVTVGRAATSFHNTSRQQKQQRQQFLELR